MSTWRTRDSHPRPASQRRKRATVARKPSSSARGNSWKHRACCANAGHWKKNPGSVVVRRKALVTNFGGLAVACVEADFCKYIYYTLLDNHLAKQIWYLQELQISAPVNTEVSTHFASFVKLFDWKIPTWRFVKFIQRLELTNLINVC